MSRKEYYQKRKEEIRDLAVDWQLTWNNYCYSYAELAYWGDFFTKYGKRYGLLVEFHESGIC